MFASTLLDRAATRWPGRTAIIDGQVRMTFRDLRDRVAQLANALAGLGLQPGDRVLDIQRNRHTYVETDLAFAAAGLVRVAVNTRLTLAEWSYIAENCGASGVVYDSEYADAVAELRSIPQVGALVRTGDEGPGHDYEQLLAGASSELPPLWRTPEDVVSLNYSSGTTGKPKGCVRTAANRLASTQDLLGSLFEGQLGADDVFLHAGPLTHASGLFVLPHLAVGATQVLLRRFDEGEVRAVIEREAVTGTVLVPTMLERLMADFDAEPVTLPTLRRLAYAGAPMAPDRIAAVNDRLGGRLVQFYGLVEAIPPITVLSAADHGIAGRHRSAGRPVLGAAVAIVDADGVPVRPGEQGELLIGGPHVMRGYWADEEATVKSVDGEWLHTGDIAWQDEDGYVYMVDRKADMIITGGYNVMPREVELVLQECAGVALACVVGVPDPAWGEAVTACVVSDPGVVLDREELQKHCAAQLSGFKKPKRIEIVDDLPKASTGKVSRSALRAALVSGDLGS